MHKYASKETAVLPICFLFFWSYFPLLLLPVPQFGNAHKLRPCLACRLFFFLPMCLRLGQAFYLTNLLLPSEGSSPPTPSRLPFLTIVSWALRAASFLPLSLQFPCVDIAPPSTYCAPTPTLTPSPTPPPFHFTFGRCRLLLFLLPVAVAVAVYRLSLPVRNGKGSTLMMGRGVGVDREGGWGFGSHADNKCILYKICKANIKN